MGKNEVSVDQENVLSAFIGTMQFRVVFLCHIVNLEKHLGWISKIQIGIVVPSIIISLRVDGVGYAA